MFQKPESEAGIEAATVRVLLAMETVSPNSPEYERLMSRLSDLNAIKVNNTKNALSKDTIAIILANLTGIVLILHYEKIDMVNSKSMAFVKKLW